MVAHLVWIWAILLVIQSPYYVAPVLVENFFDREAPVVVNLEHTKAIRANHILKEIDIHGASNRRKLLQSGNNICAWDKGNSSCIPRLFSFLPDEEIKREIERSWECKLTEGQAACENNDFCAWRAGAGCRRGNLVSTKPCLDIHYYIFRRSLECPTIARQQLCMEETACIWNTDLNACEPDGLQVVNAILANPALRVVTTIFGQCRDLSESQCTGNCTFHAELGCEYPELFNVTNFWNESFSSPYCEYNRKLLECQRRNATDCSGDVQCQISPVSGMCIPTYTFFVTVGYASKPKLQEKMLDAVEKCPSIATEQSCTAFPRKVAASMSERDETTPEEDEDDPKENGQQTNIITEVVNRDTEEDAAGNREKIDENTGNTEDDTDITKSLRKLIKRVVKKEVRKALAELTPDENK